jgi:hypothetical protein
MATFKPARHGSRLLQFCIMRTNCEGHHLLHRYNSSIHEPLLSLPSCELSKDGADGDEVESELTFCGHCWASGTRTVLMEFDVQLLALTR